MQRRRVHSAEQGAIVLNGTFTQVFTVDETNGVNIHGLRWSIGLMTTGVLPAGSIGNWVVWCLPDEFSTIPAVDTADLEGEQSNAFMWGSGVWTNCAGQTTKIEFNPAISRNCQNGARIVLVIRNNGTIGTAPSVQSIVTYFTKSL